MIVGFMLLLLASALFVWLVSRLSRRNPHDRIPLRGQPPHPAVGVERWVFVPMILLVVPGFLLGRDLGMGVIGYVLALVVVVGPGLGAIGAHNNAVGGR